MRYSQLLALLPSFFLPLVKWLSIPKVQMIKSRLSARGFNDLQLYRQHFSHFLSEKRWTVMGKMIGG
jgi:hypothetical protein